MFGRITQTECTDEYLQRNVQKDISHGIHRRISPTECTKRYLNRMYVQNWISPTKCIEGYAQRNVQKDISKECIE